MFIVIDFLHQPERGKGLPLDRVKGSSDSEIDGVVKGIKGRRSDRLGSSLYSSLLAVSPAGGGRRGKSDETVG